MIEFVLIPLGIGYLIGSIPFGLLLTRLAGLDIRTVGSGNIGATNVLRTGNRKLALATLLLDAGKGALAACVVDTLTWGAPLWGVLGAVLGHCFPVWLKFRGGKGVATALGGLLAAMPLTGVAVCVIWAVVFFFSRISSLAALVALAIAPLAAFVFEGSHTLLMTSLVSILILVRHKDNIRRLLKGEELKFTKNHADQSPSQ